MVFLKTRVSQAFWCDLTAQDFRDFQEAKIAMGGREAAPLAWFDELLKGGIVLHEKLQRPLTFLIAGPPGSGKTTLTFEICYRLAKMEQQLSLYVSTESKPEQLIENAKDFGFNDVAHTIVKMDSVQPPTPVVAVWSPPNMGGDLKEIIKIAVDSLAEWLLPKQGAQHGIAWILPESCTKSLISAIIHTKL